MHRFSRLTLAAIVLITAARAQTPAQSAQAPATQPNAKPTVLNNAATQLIVVDVAVQDKNGHPVRGLKAENVRLTENAVPQTIRQVEEHSSLTPVQQGRELPPMPPGTFTDYTAIPPDGTLNILLLDALNTPAKDQGLLRYQLQQYVKHANPATRIAIFGLANRLILLQGFTSDPASLKNVVEHKLIPRSSSPDTPKPVDDTSAPSTNYLAANLQQFEAETGTLETPLRMQLTLDAFNTLGHYLSAFPGRKNLIWFSGSFPTDILPNPSPVNSTTAAQPAASAQVDKDELRETTNLLTRARVAIYPVDASGMISQPAHTAGSGRSDTSGPHKLSTERNDFDTNPATEHAAMAALASDTGGRAFYKANDLADAVARAIDAGANYYTLVYSSANRNEDGGYREIHVDLAGAEAGLGLQLSYRRGYYAEDAGQTNAQQPNKDTGTANTSENATGARAATAAYARAAMSRGAPPPENLLFKVRVLPASTETETSVAPDNALDPSVSPKGPFRRYDVDYIAFPSEFTLSLQPDGRRTGKVEFLVYVFDANGRLLNVTGKTFSLNLTPATYAKIIHSAVESHLEISVPTSVATFLRVGIRDVTSNHFGVVEVPTDSVSHLAPPVYQTTPAPAPTKPATPAPTTSAPQPAPGAAPSVPPQS